MSQWDKLIARLKALDPDLRFEELEKILLRLGYMETQPKWRRSRKAEAVIIYSRKAGRRS